MKFECNMDEGVENSLKILLSCPRVNIHFYNVLFLADFIGSTPSSCHYSIATL